MQKTETVWPKTPPPLTPQQAEAREKYMLLWHQLLPKKYGAVERFNHGFPAGLPVKSGSRTLEIGAGLGEHAKYEDLTRQDYHCLEYREEFCEQLRKVVPPEQVWCGDIQTRQGWSDQFFDRVVAIHVLEHLPNLPAALTEINRILKTDGVFDVVIPCEGGLAHRMGRKFTAERLFRKHFKMDFTPICRNEHVNTYWEIIDELRAAGFKPSAKKFFPMVVPIASFNFVAAFRFEKRISN